MFGGNRYDYEELMNRDKTSMDILCLNPNVLASEISANLEACSNNSAKIATDLGGEKNVRNEAAHEDLCI